MGPFWRSGDPQGDLLGYLWYPDLDFIDLGYVSGRVALLFFIFLFVFVIRDLKRLFSVLVEVLSGSLVELLPESDGGMWLSTVSTKVLARLLFLAH